MTEMLRVKGWREHQHYKSKAGAPVWIKLYRRVLTDYKFRALGEPDRYRLIAIWLLASETEGLVPNDAKYVASCIGAKRVNLDLFVSIGFLENVYTDSRVVKDEGSRPELEVEEKREDQGLYEPRHVASARGEQPSSESLNGEHHDPVETLAAQFGTMP